MSNIVNETKRMCEVELYLKGEKLRYSRKKYLQLILLNGISLGQTITDPINRMKTITITIG
jgi:hypothetical protein